MSAQVNMKQFDVAVGLGAITSPVWMQIIEQVAQIYLIIGGAIILTLRLIVAFMEYQDKSRARKALRKYQREVDDAK